MHTAHGMKSVLFAAATVLVLLHLHQAQARLGCRCLDIPLVSTKTRDCCDRVGDMQGGVCNLFASNGVQQEQFAFCCSRGLTGIAASCKED
ncbi:hypothetical protein BX666DRAFT_1977666 [Dichotomocladium elegans]|nr:hypothetical protein BX666DRAFT_1977666 [Dichotomocladium elegans]